jgi:hypothetical protein
VVRIQAAEFAKYLTFLVLSILLLQHNHFAVEWLQGFFPGVKAGEA